MWNKIILERFVFSIKMSLIMMRISSWKKSFSGKHEDFNGLNRYICNKTGFGEVRAWLSYFQCKLCEKHGGLTLSGMPSFLAVYYLSLVE
jgi:hypothetical protein